MHEKHTDVHRWGHGTLSIHNMRVIPISAEGTLTALADASMVLDDGPGFCRNAHGGVILSKSSTKMGVDVFEIGESACEATRLHFGIVNGHDSMRRFRGEGMKVWVP